VGQPRHACQLLGVCACSTGSVARRAGTRGAARLAVWRHLLRSEGEEEEQGRPACGSRLAVREDRGKVRWARLGRG
jgi:hypothetical protein